MAKKPRGRGLHRLTVMEVRALAPGWHCDGGGLYAFIAAPGSGSWVYRYGGKNMGLGSLAVVSLAEARERARACRDLRAAGIDPRAKRDADRTAAKVATARAVTFDQAAAAYIKAHGPGWRNPKHRQQWATRSRPMRRPVIGGCRSAPSMSASCCKSSSRSGRTKPETAGRLRGRIEAILDWARARGYRDGENPARWKGLLDVLLPKRSKLRRVSTTPRWPMPSLPASWWRCGSARLAARALEFTILTAARSGRRAA